MRKRKKKLRKFDLPVGVVWYDVSTKQKLKAPDGDKVLGYCSFGDREIKLEANIAEHAQYITAWHEYLHALFFEMGYNEDTGNESKIECLAQNLARAAHLIVDQYMPRKK